MYANAQVLAVLAGQPRPLQALAQDSPLLDHLSQAQAAIERGAFKQAARLTLKLLKLDPINQAARRRLGVAILSHARKQIAAGRLELAGKELQAAAELTKTPKELAKVRAREGVLALLQGKLDPFQGIDPPLPPPLWEFLLAAEVLCLAPQRARPYLKQLRQVLSVAGLKIDKAGVTGLLDLALEAVAEGAPQVQLLSPAQPFLQRGAALDWREEELEAVCERLLTLEQYQLVRDYVRASHHWKRCLPALAYFDVVAKCRGAAADLDWRDLAALEKALESARDAGQHRWVARIAEFLQAYDRPGLLFNLPAELERLAQETDLTPRKIIAKLFEDPFPPGRQKVTSPFELLGVPLDADDEAIRRAYLGKVQAYPPERAPAEFQAIRWAYEQIRDRRARIEYALFHPPSLEEIQRLAYRLRPCRPSLSQFRKLLLECLDDYR